MNHERDKPEFFRVPDNIIVCSLTPPDHYGVIDYFIPQNVFNETSLFSDMFKYKSALNQEEFRYKKNLRSCQKNYTDYFKFASWYYPDKFVRILYLIYLKGNYQNGQKNITMK